MRKTCPDVVRPGPRAKACGRPLDVGKGKEEGSYVVGRIVTPKAVHLLVPRTCEYVVLYVRGDFASVI